MFNNILQHMLKRDHESIVVSDHFLNFLRVAKPHVQKDETERPISAAQPI